jgi:hypothetical protein
MTFQECELAIVRNAVDEAEAILAQKKMKMENVSKLVETVEDFIIRKKLICYGGTAINNILPKAAQFYNKELEIPDYDFYSPNALNDAKALADLYHKQGYEEIEARAGMHVGTYKVFVNFIPVADITQLPTKLFQNIYKDSISIAGIRYAPPNFLRMNMYNELSRPLGEVSRWEKVLKRLNLLNEHYPLDTKSSVCSSEELEQKLRDISSAESKKIHEIVRVSFIEQGVVFFGAYATDLFSNYVESTPLKKLLTKIPDFDVLSENPERCAHIVVETLKDQGVQNVRRKRHEAIGDIIPVHYEIQVEAYSVAFIYEPIACHSYNSVEVGNKEIFVATIDTILNFYFAFYYVDKPYYDKDRLICLAKHLFELEEKNRLEQSGLLKRFSTRCIGNDKSIEDLRAERSKKFRELRHDRKAPEFEKYFLKYNPLYKHQVKKAKTRKKAKQKKAKKKTKVEASS